MPLSFNAPMVCEISNGITTLNGRVSLSSFIVINQIYVHWVNPIEESTVAKRKFLLFRQLNQLPSPNQSPFVLLDYPHHEYLRIFPPDYNN